jgi:hypothetical protein
VSIADSKFGLALVVETSAASGGYVLGFRVDAKETLDYVHKEMSSLLQVRLFRNTCMGIFKMVTTSSFWWHWGPATRGLRGAARFSKPYLKGSMTVRQHSQMM